MDPTKCSGPFPDPPIPDIDDEGYVVPPWVKYPNLRVGSMGWRMGMGEWHLEKFRNWWAVQSDETCQAFKAKYPEPEEWHGFRYNP
jgi:hypothetical protein